MDHDNLSDPSDEFGELFEGETAVFESTLSDGEDLDLGNGIDIPVTTSYQNHRLAGHSGSIHNFDNTNTSTSGSRNPITVGDFQFIPDEYMLQNNVDDDDDESDLQQANSQQVAGSRAISNRSSEGNETGNQISKDEKRIKIKIVKDAEHFGRLNINKYLQKRGYREVKFSKSISKEDFSLNINPKFSGICSVTNGANYETEDIFNELERFWKFYCWMKVRKSSMSIELRPMLIPMLAFFFRELYVSRLLQHAFKLTRDFCKRFMFEDKSKDNCRLLLKLSNIQSPKDFLEDKYLKTVFQKEYKFVLSNSTFTHLKRFLSKSNRPVLINLFSSTFVLEMRSSQELSEAYCQTEDSDSESEQEDLKTNEVLRVIDSVRGSVQANLPSVIVYTTNELPICGAISGQATTVAYGMSSSGIRICSSSSAKKLFGNYTEENDQQYTPAITTFSGHEGSVYGLAFHPRTKLLFSVGQDRFMRAWDFNNTNSVQCKVVYRGHLGPIWTMDITNSGQLLVTGSSDSTARIWIPEKLDCVRILAGHYLDIDTVRFHPNEAYVATGSIDKSVRFWSVADGKMARIMTSSEGRVSAIAFHSSGKYIVGGGEEDKLRIWDIGEGQLIAELPSYNNCKDLSFCGNMLSACFKNGKVQIWNLRRIVGGDDTNKEMNTPFIDSTVPAPCTIDCDSSSLFKVYYKDPCNLYCLGCDPILEGNDSIINTFENVSIASATVSSNESSDSPMYLKFTNSESEAVSTMTLDVITPSSNSANNVTPDEEDSNNFVQEAEGENTNNTITSSDMEFEVDDQMLQSLVDGTLL